MLKVHGVRCVTEQSTLKHAKKFILCKKSTKYIVETAYACADLTGYICGVADLHGARRSSTLLHCTIPTPKQSQYPLSLHAPDQLLAQQTKS